MLFWLASYPRAGSNFLWTVIRDVCGIQRASIEDCPQLMSELLGGRACDAVAAQRQLMMSSAQETSATSQAPQFTWNQQAWTKRNVTELMADPRPYMLKTHCLSAESNVPAVYIVRDGRDVLVSYAKYTPRSEPGYQLPKEVFRDNLMQRMVQGCPRYGTWSTNVESWIDRPNTIVVRFSDLIRDPMAVVERLRTELSVPLVVKGDELPTFEQLHTQNPQLYRRGKVGSWRDEFPADLLPTFWEHHGSMMERLGFSEERAAVA
ncbi:MAG: sulfotransferase domain-containing protein [Planctomycetaceae bacterium]